MTAPRFQVQPTTGGNEMQKTIGTGGTVAITAVYVAAMWFMTNFAIDNVVGFFAR